MTPTKHTPSKLHQLLRDFWRHELGSTAIEYALLASLIALVIIASVTTLGGSVNSLFQSAADGVQ